MSKKGIEEDEINVPNALSAFRDKWKMKRKKKVSKRVNTHFIRQKKVLVTQIRFNAPVQQQHSPPQNSFRPGFEKVPSTGNARNNYTNNSAIDSEKRGAGGR